MLIEHGVDINAQGGIYSNALRAASLGDHEEVMQMLLDWGAGIYAKSGDIDPQSTLATVNNLGSLYENRGKLKETEKMYLRALAGYQKALGAEHPDTLASVRDLGLVFERQRKYEEAEEIYQRALAGRKKV